MTERCNANPCCMDPVNCKVPLPQHHTGFSHLNDKQTLSQAEVDVLAERRRQVEAEGWALEHDDSYSSGEMAGAAACYALYRSHVPVEDVMGTDILEMAWPWDVSWWKPKDRRRDLVRAGALIIAELERLDRASLLPKEEGR